PQTAEGKNGAIATAHPLASRAGIDMLRAGGNAIAAAVAASFAISVVRPQSTSLAGGGFLILHEDGKQRVYDFRERAPLAATRDMYLDANGEPRNFVYDGHEIEDAAVNGHLAVGTPGLVAGLVKVHQQ